MKIDIKANLCLACHIQVRQRMAGIMACTKKQFVRERRHERLDVQVAGFPVGYRAQTAVQSQPRKHLQLRQQQAPQSS